MPRKTKEQKEQMGILKRTRRSGAYLPNSAGTGITKAPKPVQKQFKTTMTKAIKGLRKGL